MLCHKILRQRWVLGVIFFCSLLYFLATTFSKRQDLVSEDYASKRTLRQPFQWEPLPDADRNDTQVRLCRNSQQGKSLIVDEKGYVCRREELSSNQCCDSKHGLVTRYVCESCLPNGCCSIYEHCVSCCLQPDKQPLLRRILKEAVDETFVRFASEVKDQFELCLAKCRTSSQSVQHETPTATRRSSIAMVTSRLTCRSSFHDIGDHLLLPLLLFVGHFCAQCSSIFH